MMVRRMPVCLLFILFKNSQVIRVPKILFFMTRVLIILKALKSISNYNQHIKNA